MSSRPQWDGEPSPFGKEEGELRSRRWVLKILSVNRRSYELESKAGENVSPSCVVVLASNRPPNAQRGTGTCRLLPSQFELVPVTSRCL